MVERPDTQIVVDIDTYRYFATRALRGMREIVLSLGDDLACSTPPLPGANTPYGLLTHCLGVAEYWGGHVVAGRTVARDREAEFSAAGRVGDLAHRVDKALEQLAEDLTTVEAGGEVRNEPARWALGPGRRLNQAGALLHLYEELAQHHGQMEVLRDALHNQPPARFEDVAVDWLRRKQGVKWHRPGPKMLPAWVADMDFPVAPPIRDALIATVDRGALGYPDWPVHPLAEPFRARMECRHAWRPDPAHVRGVTDLIQALQIVLELATKPGDGVLAHVPNYPPFLETVRRSGRVLLPAPLLPDGPDSWNWDHDALQRAASGTRAKVLLLVNPHNPTGRVFRADELARLANLAERLDLVVVADEIWADLVHAPHRHIPFASLSSGTAARTVTVTAATKAFNLAGLRTAVAHVGPPVLRAVWDAEPPDLFGATNVLGVEATRAAWEHGGPWLAAARRHLGAQRDNLAARLAGSALTMRPPQATYLAWLDCSAASLPTATAAWFRQHADVELSPGPDFGSGYEHFARLNFATTPALLASIVDRLLTSLPYGRHAQPQPR
jgi:bifunctional pyridoxal-dependent enzyme with beta-cystathionase and maltose regulon repressor activities